MNSSNTNSSDILTNARIVFWDFDGVIKDSANIKQQAYIDMFAHHGAEIQNKVLSIYKAGGGMSRFKLIPILFNEIFCVALTDKQLNIQLNLYSDMVIDRVIQSAYIPGILDYLRYNFKRQKFLIVTNTPKSEIDIILRVLNLEKYFQAVFGAPDLKEDIVKCFLKESHIDAKYCVFVGDSKGDFEAAQNNAVPFIYRGMDNPDYHKYWLPHFQVQ